MELAVPLSPRRTTQALIIAVMALTLASAAGQFSMYVLGHERVLGLVQLFDPNSSGNVGIWYKSSTLLLAAILLGVIAYAKNGHSERYISHWTVLSIVFLCLSFEEVTGTHIKTNGLLPSVFGLHDPWVFPVATFVALFYLVYRKFLDHLPQETRLLFLAAGAVFVFGAIGLELTGEIYLDVYGKRNIAYALITTAEEFNEMTGIVIFIYALMRYTSLYLKDLQVRIGTS